MRLSLQVMLNEAFSISGYICGIIGTLAIQGFTQCGIT